MHSLECCLYFFQMVILSMHLLLGMNVMLDFIWIGPVYLQGAQQNTNWEMIAHSGTQTHNLEICSMMP